jgi:mono/diheme cytochrome c family protein
MATLGGLGALDAATLQPLFADASPDVRAWALRWSEPWLAQPGHPLAAAALRLMGDRHWTVRRQLAASIGELPRDARVEPALAILQRYGADAVTVDAVVSGLGGMEADVLARLLQDTSHAEAAEGIAMLAAALAHSHAPAVVAPVLAQAGQTERPAWQRTALLRGLETGLAAPEAGAAAGTGRAAPPSPTVKLPAAPASLVRASAEPGDVGALAKAVAARLDWPGKPIARVEARPLTADEQSRFEAGRALYGNLCLSCHGVDGRGREHQAPALAGSALLLAEAGVPIRIVLAGKEGDIGLMPPLATLGDAEIASVLTYVRHAWGNAAPPVDGDAVKEVRGATGSRTRPWTADELRALAALRTR